MDDSKELKLEFKDESESKELSKEEKIAKEKQKLLQKVLAGNLKTTKEKVGFILNSYSSARNSDIDLAWLYWSTFESEKFNGQYISKSQLMKLTRIGSLSRARAKIQNEYKLFQADETVKKYRGKLKDEKRDEAIEDKPSGVPPCSIFIDEAGKTQDNIVVGSLWLIDGGLSSLKTNRELQEWTEKNNINYEFHFSKVSKNKLQSYKDFFLKFLALNPTIGFKVIMVQNIGFRDLSIPITDLTFHLIDKGISHENKTGRATLPRILSVWLDDEEKGSDKLKLENLKERIKAQKINGLYFGNFEAVVSKNNFFIQAVDLFTSSINRKININKGGNFKDELADFILNTLRFDISSLNKIDTDIDNATVFNLTHTD